MAILVEEAAYARELAAFLSSKEEFLYRPVAFTDAQAYLRFERENTVDLLLCDRGMEPEEREDGPQKVCILSEYSAVGEEADGRSCVFKYQSADLLMKDILACVNAEEKERPAFYDASERVSQEFPRAEAAKSGFASIAVCSPVGGSRCSTYALALADHLARRARTLFVSLDPFFRVPGIKGSAPGDISELLYYLETAEEGSAPSLTDYIESGRGADILRGPSHWLDLEDPGKDALAGLNSFIEKSGYECAVYDLGRPGSAGTELLRGCTEIVVTRRKNAHDEEALAEWRRQLKALGLAGVADMLSERIVPDDRAAANLTDRGLLLEGSLGAFIRQNETEGSGHY